MHQHFAGFPGSAAHLLSVAEVCSCLRGLLMQTIVIDGAEEGERWSKTLVANATSCVTVGKISLHAVRTKLAEARKMLADTEVSTEMSGAPIDINEGMMRMGCLHDQFARMGIDAPVGDPLEAFRFREGQKFP